MYKCYILHRYVQAGGTKRSYNFVIPLHDCGTTQTGGFGKTVDNIIVIQSDDTVQVSYSLLQIERIRDTGTEFS